MLIMPLPFLLGCVARYEPNTSRAKGTVLVSLALSPAFSMTWRSSLAFSSGRSHLWSQSSQRWVSCTQQIPPAAGKKPHITFILLDGAFPARPVSAGRSPLLARLPASHRGAQPTVFLACRD